MTFQRCFGVNDIMQLTTVMKTPGNIKGIGAKLLLKLDLVDIASHTTDLTLCLLLCYHAYINVLKLFGDN